MNQKRLLALGLASAMTLSMASVAAAADIKYGVGAIDDNGYAYDSDKSSVDLTNANPTFSYGDTIYYPLLSDKMVGNAEQIAAAQKALSEKVSLHEAALAASDTANKNLTAARDALAAAQALKVKAEAVLAAAEGWQNATADIAAKQAAYVAAVAAYDNALVAAVDAATAVNEATKLVSLRAQDIVTAEGVATSANNAANTANGNVTAAKADVDKAQTALNELTSANFKYVYEYDAVSGIKIKQNWDANGKLINGVQIVKKKTIATSELPEKYIYFVAVALKDSTSTSSADISGTIQLRKSGANGFDYEERQLEVSLEVGFPVASEPVITPDLQVFKEGAGFTGDTEEEFSFEADPDSYFTVNTVGQGKLLLKMDTKFDSAIAGKNPSANLDFFNGNGASFNKLGTMTLSAEKGSFLYQVNGDGSLTRIKADYDDVEETFVFRTRVLGRYVISDIELKNVSPVTPDNGNNNNNNGTGKPTNPGTGAAL